MRRFACVSALSLFTVASVLAACSSSDGVQAAPAPADPEPSAPDAEADAAPPPDAAPATPTISFPHVLSRGGPTIKAPKVQPIVFASDPLASEIGSFTTKIGASSYWSTLGAEYGVGPMTALPNLDPGEPAPTNITVAQITAWLQDKLSGAAPAFGAPDESTLYAIYYPASTTIVDDGSGLGQSCKGYGGFHDEIVVAGKAIGYAVLPRCADIDDLTVSASHEYYEWATDPFPYTNPAFAQLDSEHWAWQATMIGELGDLCTFLDRDNLKPAEIGFLVQRQWSNKASLAGKYPCAPIKSVPYFQAIPETPDEVEVGDPFDRTMTVKTKAIVVGAGTSRTVDAFVYSDQPAGAVYLRALSYSDFGGAKEPSGFTYALASTKGKVGSHIAVTITAPKKMGFDLLVLSTSTGDQEVHYWPVLVTTEGAQAAGAQAVSADALAKRFGRALPHHATKLGMGLRAR